MEKMIFHLEEKKISGTAVDPELVLSVGETMYGPRCLVAASCSFHPMVRQQHVAGQDACESMTLAGAGHRALCTADGEEDLVGDPLAKVG